MGARGVEGLDWLQKVSRLVKDARLELTWKPIR